MTTETPQIPVWNVEVALKPLRTIPRFPSIDDMDPMWAGLSVGEFIGAPQTSPDGGWEINRFEIDDKDMLADYMRSQGDGHGRWAVGKGEFIRLNRIVHGAGPEGADLKQIVMSNTPQEMIDHKEALDDAYGYVLVHGLGLSCVVSALLAKPEVRHIDVVEIEQGVIDMIAPAYEHESRVTIHHGSCLDYPWPRGKRWNYVWHDIWSEISMDNLSDDSKAEHGISYATMHRKFGGRCDMQASWAFKQALAIRRRKAAAAEKKAHFEARWRKATPDARVEMLIDFYHDGLYSAPGVIEKPSREEAVRTLEHFGQLGQYRQWAARDEPPNMYFEW